MKDHNHAQMRLTRTASIVALAGAAVLGALGLLFGFASSPDYNEILRRAVWLSGSSVVAALFCILTSRGPRLGPVPVLAILCIFGALANIWQATVRLTNQRSIDAGLPVSGVVLRSYDGALNLESTIVPSVALEGCTGVDLAEILETQIFGQQQYSDPSRRTTVAVSASAMDKRFTAHSTSSLSALQLLVELAADAPALIIVDRGVITIR